MTWEAYQTFMNAMREHLAMRLEENRLQAGENVELAGDVISLAPRAQAVAVPEPVTLTKALFARVRVVQSVGEIRLLSQADRDSGLWESQTFEYPIQMVTSWQSLEDMRDIQIPVTPDLWLVHSGSYRSGVSGSPDERWIDPLIRQAEITLYLLGFLGGEEMTFDEGFNVGRVQLRLQQRGLEVLGTQQRPVTQDYTLTVTAAGNVLSLSSIAPGDSGQTLTLTDVLKV